ncbi:MAG: osmoprotectant transport system permease protein [Miltoncostaeaceae bacterium]|nr:osmoprotectant transport system permease protein [Miltoncostaeaceae bacterium]
MAEIRWDWISRNADEIQARTIEHLALVSVSTGIAVAVAIPIGIAVRGRRIPFATATGVAGILYTIPSLAMFAFLLPIFGIGFTPAVVGLVLYALLILIRNTAVGLEGVPPAVREASVGMGLTPRQVLTRVELPLALPAIMAGIRLAMVSTVGIATVAVLIGGGGLGSLIYSDGIQRGLFLTPIVVGAVCATVMAIALDLLLVLAERMLTPWARARTGDR